MEHWRNILWGLVGGITWQVADWWVRRRSYNAALRDIEELLFAMDAEDPELFDLDEALNRMRKLRK